MSNSTRRRARVHFDLADVADLPAEQWSDLCEDAGLPVPHRRRRRRHGSLGQLARAGYRFDVESLADLAQEFGS